MELKYVGEAKLNKQDVSVLRDIHGKWWVKVNGITTQKKLTATEIVRYLLNAGNQPLTLNSGAVEGKVFEARNRGNTFGRFVQNTLRKAVDEESALSHPNTGDGKSLAQAHWKDSK